jgi:hypothetical protein
MKTMKLEDFKAEARKRFGPDNKKWKFQCPHCKTAQSAEDLVAAGVSKDDINKYVGFSCIGRFTKDKGCDWTLGGLFQIHEIEIEIADGTKHVSFDLAPN